MDLAVEGLELALEFPTNVVKCSRFIILVTVITINDCYQANVGLYISSKRDTADMHHYKSNEEENHLSARSPQVKTT